MEIFIDLAKIADGSPEPTIPGIDLNLSGLVDFKKEETSPGIMQAQLRNETELVSPGFNPAEYFAQIQAEFNKIKAAQESPSVKDDTKVFQAVQQNSNAALDPIAAYLEQRLRTIETITNSKDEIRQLIQGNSDNTLTNAQAVVNTPLNQTVELAKESSVGAIADTLSSILEGNSDLAQGSFNTTVNNQLATTDESNTDLLSQTMSNLSETISNFATTIINGGSQITNNLAGTTQILPEPKRDLLPITREAIRPDYGAASLSAMQQLVAGVSDTNTNLTTANSQYNNITNLVNSDQGQANRQATNQESGNSENQVVFAGGSGDNSGSVYLMQMLNLMKSGQLKVKIQ